MNVYNFTTFYGSNDKLTFDLKTNSNIPVTNGNISIRVYFKDNGGWVGNYSCLSGEGWIPDLPVGSYYAIFDTEYVDFQPINRTITITIPNVRYYVNVTSVTTNNKTVNITAKSNIPKNILWDGKIIFVLPDGTSIDATYGANGIWWAEHTFDDYGEYNVNATYVGLDNVAINSGTMALNKVNSTITLDNIVLDYGESKNITVTTTGANGITARFGESEAKVEGFVISIPVLDAGNYTLTVTTIADEDYNPVTKEVNITVNKVNSTLTVEDMVFDYGSSGSIVVSFTGAEGVNASVIGQSGAVVEVNGTNITVSRLNAGTYILTVTTIADVNHNNISKNVAITVNKVNATLTVDDVVLDYGEVMDVTVIVDGASDIAAKIGESEVDVDGFVVSIPVLDAGVYSLTVTAIGDVNHNNISKNVAITVNKVNATLTVDDVVVDYGETVNVTVVVDGASDIAAKIGESEARVDGFVISIPVLDAGTYTLTVTAIADVNHNNISKNVAITVNKVNSTLTVDDIVFDYGSSGSMVVSFTGAEGVNASVIGQSDAVVKVDGVNITVSRLNAGTYILTVTTIPDEDHYSVTLNATITVNPIKTQLIANAVTATYNANKYFVITLKDANGNPISGVSVTVELNGVKTYSTDKNGQVKLATKTLVPKKYSAKATFNGNANYLKSSKTIKVTVKKATPKLTAKKKTFKKSVKVKKYKITLKYGKTALKKVKVYIKIKGKTYKATTNKKGKAIFKIKKLTKKGKYNAKITYKGNKYYNKITKKVKITVK